MRAPVLAPAGFDHHHNHQLTGHHQHGRSQNQNHNHNHSHSHNHNLTMADPYLASDEELAHLQKLSSEYEPEATVRLPCCGSCSPGHPSLTVTRAR
jgi:ubiquitin thioesterase protein OTUB1